jgi:hypothetical protein
MALVRRIVTAALLSTSVLLGSHPWVSRLTHATGASATPGIAALPGYHVSVFARGTATSYKPDSIEYDGAHIWVGYQNGSDPTGANHRSSTIVEYTMSGSVVKTYAVLDHCDGLRVDPATGMVWATSNEDANPILTIINPATGAAQVYHLGKTPHGGGYDDLAFLHGVAYISASNPNTNAAGINTAPALGKVSINGAGVTIAPVVMGNAPAKDMTTGKMTSLNMIDPDSLSLDPQGDIVQDNQGGSQLIFVHHAGTLRQTVSVLPLADQVDDTVWATAAQGRLLVVDSTHNVIYTVTTRFKPGAVYTEAPSDSSIPGVVGTLDLSSGTITPVMIGLGNPTGLAFIPGMPGM